MTCDNFIVTNLYGFQVIFFQVNGTAVMVKQSLINKIGLSSGILAASMMAASCGGSSGGNDDPVEENIYAPTISNIGISRDDSNSLLDVSGDYRDVNGLVSVGYDVADDDDLAYGVTPTSTCKARLGDSGVYNLSCDGIDLNDFAGSTLEAMIDAFGTYGDASNNDATEYLILPIHQNTVGAFVSTIGNTGCDLGATTSLSDTYVADAEGDSSTVSYIVDGTPIASSSYDCSVAGVKNYGSKNTDTYGAEESNASSGTITVCTGSQVWDSFTKSCFYV